MEQAYFSVMELKKILLVDDSQPFNFLSKTVLKQNKVNCTVVEVLNGQIALDYLTENQDWPEVILLDINMPVMDGFQFLEAYQKLNKQGKETKIFVLSSSSREEDREKSLSCEGVEDFFDKPLTESHIRIILSKLQSN
jgi:CheY-like chemotaxis protein